ncbi:PLP-dependent transferase, partial [Paenibacillus sepulcri]|nr:PLP-dependent transferase [Paenibacillus sepulcri]
VFQKPLQLGVDLSVHSISKYIGGHSDCIGGVVIGSAAIIKALFNKEYMLFGGIMTPQTAALVSKGLRTLPLRLRRHEASALKVAAFMQTLPFVVKVNHPGLESHPQHQLAMTQMSGSTSLFSFESPMELSRIKEWANRLKYFKIAVSWGGFESLVTVNKLNSAPADSPRVVVRIYIGLEEPEDLMADIESAWKQVEALELP